MCFVDVDRTGELRLLAHGVREDDDLLEQEDCHLLQLVAGSAGRVVGAEQRPVQQQLALRHDLTLTQQTLEHHPARWLEKFCVFSTKLVVLSRNWNYTLTSNPCSRPMSIMSLAWLGTTVITWNACSIAAASSMKPALWLCLSMAWNKCWCLILVHYFSINIWMWNLTSSSMWYFVSLCIGLIRRSVKRNLNPYFNLISWKEENIVLSCFCSHFTLTI